MTDKAKAPPGFSAFKEFLGRLVKVPKKEIDRKETEYQRERSERKKPA